MSEIRELEEIDGTSCHGLLISWTVMCQTAVFPSVTIAFKIYMTVSCSSCEGKRYFSKLFLNKNERALSECVCLEIILLRKEIFLSVV